MNGSGSASFQRRWVSLNTAALVAGYVLYTPIAHGITGGHIGSELSGSQLAAHSLALAVVGALVACAQRRALAPFVAVTRQRVLATAILFNAAFWAGYYQPWLEGPDTDILLGYLVLGSGSWLGNVPANRHRVAALVALLSFPIASFVGELCLFVAFTLLQVTPAVDANAIQHSAFWLMVGGVTGLLGGWVSGLALRRMLPATRGHSAAQLGVGAVRESLAGGRRGRLGN